MTTPPKAYLKIQGNSNFSAESVKNLIEQINEETNMATYTPIAQSEIDPDSPLTESLFRQFGTPALKVKPKKKSFIKRLFGNKNDSIVTPERDELMRGRDD